MAPAPCALYVRISHDPSQQRAGVERQLADCRAIARKRGWDQGGIEVYEDNDASAYRGHRPAFTRLLADLPKLHAVIAWDMDRLVRQPRDLERFLDRAADSKLIRVATAQGDIDLTSHDGQLHARILAAVAKKESDDKSRRVKRAAASRAEEGRWHGGPPPFGYRLAGGTLKIDTASAKVVRHVAVGLVEGRSLASMTRAHQHVPGAPQTPQGWRYILRSPALIARTRTGHRASWKPILDEQLAANVRAVLEDPKRLTQRGTALSHWLTGVLVCGACGGPMRSHISKDRHRYRCASCMGTTVLAEPVEEFVEGAIMEAAPRTRPTEVVEHEGPQVVDQQALDALAVDYASGLITRSEWMAARALVTQAAQTPTKVANVTPPTNPVTMKAWATWDAVERRRVALWLLERVIVHTVTSKGRELEDRIEFIWRR